MHLNLRLKAKAYIRYRFISLMFQNFHIIECDSTLLTPFSYKKLYFQNFLNVFWLLGIGDMVKELTY